MTAELLPEYEYSPETLMHYRHPGCPDSPDPWWSISGGSSEKPCFCPYCGERLNPAQYEPPVPKPAPPAQELDL